MFGFFRFIPSRSIFFVYFVIVLTSSSCNKQRDTHLASQQHFLETLEKAKRVDTPIPLGFFLAHKEGSSQAEALTYHGSLSINLVQDFYRKEMEREGWDIVDFSNDHEGMFFCQKTGRSCIISVKTHRKKTLLRLFIKNSSFTDLGKIPNIVHDSLAISLSDLTKDTHVARL